MVVKNYDVPWQPLDKVYLRGHQPGILDAPPQVQWRDVIETGKGYRIRKLRYEGYPGLWVPALLYEPENLPLFLLDDPSNSVFMEQIV